MFTTGLKDFGEKDFIEPMEILTSDYRTGANLNRLGKIAAWTYLHRMLSNRLRLNAFYKSQRTSEQRIDRPIFIVGLPRTGSTLLHEMMAMHSDLPPLFWETSLRLRILLIFFCDVSKRSDNDFKYPIAKYAVHAGHRTAS